MLHVDHCCIEFLCQGVCYESCVFVEHDDVTLVTAVKKDWATGCEMFCVNEISLLEAVKLVISQSCVEGKVIDFLRVPCGIIAYRAWIVAIMLFFEGLEIAL